MNPRKNVLVVGGAGGIGAACCVALAANWCPVVVDLNEKAATAVAAECGGRGFSCDVSDPAQVSALAERVEAECGPLEGLVFAAGVIPFAASPKTTGAADWDRIFDVNARGAYLMSREVGLRMAARGRGSIVLLSSIAGLVGTPHLVYGPSKAALTNLASGLAVHWGRQGVRVNSVSPGPVRTPTIEASYARGERDPKLLAQQTALGRIITPAEIAAPIVFLLSDAASAITGTDIVIDAGSSATLGWNLFGGAESVLLGLERETGAKA